MIEAKDAYDKVKIATAAAQDIKTLNDLFALRLYKQEKAHRIANKFLSCFKVIIEPKFNLKSVVKNKAVGGLGKSTKASLAMLAHGICRLGLEKQAGERGNTVVDANEGFTTRCCAGCGKANSPGQSKFFHCNRVECKKKYYRDEAGAANIGTFTVTRLLQQWSKKPTTPERNSEVEQGVMLTSVVPVAAASVVDFMDF
jgi:transposase